MISLGLRFSLKGGREAGFRLVFTALGVAVGVALLLFTLSGFNGLKAKDQREGWLLTRETNTRPSVNEKTADPLWWRIIYDSYGDRPLLRVEVAANGARSPVPPGLPKVPRAGEHYVSPALARLLATTPRDALGARLPGRGVGIIGDAGLTNPDALIAVVGRPAVATRQSPAAMQVRSIETAPKPHDYNAFFKIILGLGAAGLLIPVLMFVATSTRLAAARREERFAALRLVGATPRQINQIASVEAGLVARIPFTGDPFFTSDLSLGWLAIVCVAVGVPLAAVVVGLWSLRRVRISPLGVTRHVTPRPPRAWRVAPVLLGLGVLVVARYAGSSASLWAVIGAFAVIIIGLMIAGPWLTMAGARLLAKLARRDSTLIAGRRLADDPGRAFRAISGMVLAVFVGTVFIGVIGTAIAHGNGFATMTLPKGTVTDSLDTQQSGALAPAALGGSAERAAHHSPALFTPTELLARLRALDGVRQVLPIYKVPTEGSGPAPGDAVDDGLIAASGWDRLGVYGRVAAGGGSGANGAVISVPTNELLNGDLTRRTSWTAGPWREGELSGYPLKALLVTTNGSEVAVERVRTALMAALPAYSPPVSASQLGASSKALINLLQRMVDVGIILSLVIAGCSLAVSVAGGLIERKRPFTLLRLAGMPLAHLRRVVVLEAAVPLVLVALVSAAAGFIAADLILRATPNGFGVSPPAMSYYVLMAGGLAAALAGVCAALPLLDRVTQIQTARTE
jgi:FtsX-like permease family